MSKKEKNTSQNLKKGKKGKKENPYQNLKKKEKEKKKQIAGQ